MISVVVPLLDERDSLPALFGELSAAFAGREAEFVFVDDGSRDGSWGVLRRLAAADPRVRAIRLRRNFGKAAALSAGFRESSGQVVLTLDADGQDDPAEVPRFLDALEGGLDVVSGWKKHRRDPWHKVGPSRLFNWAVSALTGCHLHDHNCGFKAYRRAVIREVEIYGELHRFIPVLAHARGFRVGEIVVHHRPRRLRARSKYGVARLVKGFLDLMTVRFLTRFRQSPLHVLGSVGLVLLMLVGGLGMLYLAIEWAAGDRPIGDRPLLSYSATLLGVGAQFLSLGILAELVTSYNLRPGRHLQRRRADPDPDPRPETTGATPMAIDLEDGPDRGPTGAVGGAAVRGPAGHRRGHRAGAGRGDEVAHATGGQRHLAVVYGLEPPGARLLRHRRLPLAGQDAGQGAQAGEARPTPPPAPGPRAIGVRSLAPGPWKAAGDEPVRSASIRASPPCSPPIAGRALPDPQGLGQSPWSARASSPLVPRGTSRSRTRRTRPEDDLRPRDAQGPRSGGRPTSSISSRSSSC